MKTKASKYVKFRKFKIGNVEFDTVNMREVHAFLDISTPFSTWITRSIPKYGLTFAEDYSIEMDGKRKEYHMKVSKAVSIVRDELSYNKDRLLSLLSENGNNGVVESRIVRREILPSPQNNIVCGYFSFEGNRIRTIKIDDCVWFVAKDVCVALSRGNPTEATRMIGDDDAAILIVDGRINSHGIGPYVGARMIVCTIRGVCFMVAKSRAACAIGSPSWRFQKAVMEANFSESLQSQAQEPAIQALLPPPSTAPSPAALRAIADQWADVHRRADEAERAMEEMRAYADGVKDRIEAADRLLASKGALTLTQAAMALNVTRASLLRFLRDDRNKWTYVDSTSNRDFPNTDRVRDGFLEFKNDVIENPKTGELFFTGRTRITARGLHEISRIINSGSYPFEFISREALNCVDQPELPFDGHPNAPQNP